MRKQTDYNPDTPRASTVGRVFFLTNDSGVGSDATDEAAKDGNLEYKSDEAHFAILYLWLCHVYSWPPVGSCHCCAINNSAAGGGGLLSPATRQRNKTFEVTWEWKCNTSVAYRDTATGRSVHHFISLARVVSEQ